MPTEFEWSNYKRDNDRKITEVRKTQAEQAVELNRIYNTIMDKLYLIEKRSNLK